MELTPDYYYGFKVTKPLGGSSIDYTFSRDVTSPKRGQKDRTGSYVNSATFSILDKESIGRFSEKKSAHISYQKALDELAEIKQSITSEVRETYYNCQKTIVQLGVSQDKIKFKEVALTIARARGGLNEILASDVLRAETELMDEKSFYLQVVASFYQNLAKLNKSLGYSLL